MHLVELPMFLVNKIIFYNNKILINLIGNWVETTILCYCIQLYL